ncbi:flavin containing amine oxidoreductase [Fragilaria crotonensis]|nr:flavin containing amine oxidoreductase [Fragilaria crotonensis]
MKVSTLILLIVRTWTWQQVARYGSAFTIPRSQQRWTQHETTSITTTTLSMNNIEPIEDFPNGSPDVNDSSGDSLTDEIISATVDVAKDLAIAALDATEKGLEAIDDAHQVSKDKLKKEKKYLVIGGGWGGWGAAKALCESGIDAEVILLDALPDPTGKTPYLSKTGKPVEAGTRGFWKDYPNINKLCQDLGLSDDEVFSPFTNSSFYSPDGLEATAPVFSEAKLPKLPDIPFFHSSQNSLFHSYHHLWVKY